MRESSHVTRLQLVAIVKAYEKLYDIVRLVDPVNMNVVTLCEKGIKIAQKESCFSVWNKSERCANCTSLRACQEEKEITKEEYRDQEKFKVISMPFIVVDFPKATVVVLELVKEVHYE